MLLCCFFYLSLSSFYSCFFNRNSFASRLQSVVVITNVVTLKSLFPFFVSFKFNLQLQLIIGLYELVEHDVINWNDILHKDFNLYFRFKVYTFPLTVLIFPVSGMHLILFEHKMINTINTPFKTSHINYVSI